MYTCMQVVRMYLILASFQKFVSFPPLSVPWEESPRPLCPPQRWTCEYMCAYAPYKHTSISQLKVKRWSLLSFRYISVCWPRSQASIPAIITCNFAKYEEKKL